MTCDEATLLLQAHLDCELDAGHTREVEQHLATCAICAAQWQVDRQIHDRLAEADLRWAAPKQLRARIEMSLPVAPVTDRRSLLKGFAAGSALSAIAASAVVVLALRRQDEQRILSEAVSAHLRSLQPGHLTDVLSTDQHVVKPWFNGRPDVAPPVVDLAAKGFLQIGARLDYIDGRTVGVLVYRRRTHVINLFVAHDAAQRSDTPQLVTRQGFNMRGWSDRGIAYWAVSDLNNDELADFAAAFAASANAS